MTDKEKAKAYDEAIERARKLYNSEETSADVEIACETLFPELKESEDERIRKEIIYFLNRHFSVWRENIDNYKSWVAWLEKQVEREPKFRIGDTIKKKSTGDIVIVSEVDLKNREYRLSNTGFIPFKYEYLWELVEQKPDKVEPKFKYGDRVRNKKSGLEQTLGSCIEDVYEGAFPFRIKDQDDWELVEQKPAECKKKYVFLCIGEDVYHSLLNEEEIEDFKAYMKGE